MVHIRKMKEEDRAAVYLLISDFFASDAVATTGSPEIFHRNITEAVGSSPFLDGYVFAAWQAATAGEQVETIVGYAMVSHTFNVEYGRHCLWIEDLYLTSLYRGAGLGPLFIDMLKEDWPDAMIRLEVEEENTHALHVYEKAGFRKMPYEEFFYLNDVQPASTSLK